MQFELVVLEAQISIEPKNERNQNSYCTSNFEAYSHGSVSAWSWRLRNIMGASRRDVFLFDAPYQVDLPFGTQQTDYIEWWNENARMV